MKIILHEQLREHIRKTKLFVHNSILVSTHFIHNSRMVLLILLESYYSISRILSKD